MESLAVFLFYFAPSIVAVFRRRDRLLQVIALNLFLGWTVVGWLFAWVLVFQKLNDLFVATIIKLFGGRGAGAGPGARAPGHEEQTPQGESPCLRCGGSRVEACPKCQGRGSWYDQPQTASGIAQLVQCTYCTSSGRVTCQFCGGSGRRY